MAVVVRCPSCRGASRVGSEAVGLLVVCPRCSDPFLAVEEAVPVTPARPPRPDRRRSADPPAPPRPAPAPAEPDHHAADHHHAPLPTSVLIGLALLPFVIPLVWLIGPIVAGQPPELSVAAPTALAFTASVLCLAVIYTIDWTPATRIKGVLMLVGLAYFAGLSLYFLKKDMVDRVKQFFGPDHEWITFEPPGENFRVNLPSHAKPARDQPVPGWALTARRAAVPSLTGEYVCVFGYGDDPAPVGQPDDRWFDDAKQAILRATGGRVLDQLSIEHRGNYPGRQWEIQLADGLTHRVVRVFRVEGRIYYLAAEGPNLTPDDDFAQTFFQSFLVTPARE